MDSTEKYQIPYFIKKNHKLNFHKTSANLGFLRLLIKEAQREMQIWYWDVPTKFLTCTQEKYSVKA